MMMLPDTTSVPVVVYVPVQSIDSAGSKKLSKFQIVVREGHVAPGISKSLIVAGLGRMAAPSFVTVKV